MASKVMVKLPVAPFGQVNKTKSGSVGNNEVIMAKHQEVPKYEEKTPEQMRLEQNIRFLQDQHQLMLAGLHSEIEKLKARNKELQFQLIFGKVSPNSTSSSSPEDDGKHKLYTSPKLLTNTTPLQVELLEKEMGELKLQLEDQEGRNLYLSAIVDEQKKQLERYDRRREKEQQRTNSVEAEVELLRKLEDAESMIRRLRRENSDLRREQSDYQSPRGPRGGRQHHRSGHHYNNRGGGGGGGWFPPLHSQNFWQGGRQNDRPQNQPPQNLPDLPMNETGSSSHHQPYHGKKSNNNHNYHGERKYRNGPNKGNNKPS